MSQSTPKHATQLTSGTEKGLLQCPVCQSSLKAYHFNAVETDVCPQGCGLWLDQNELRHLEQSDGLEAIDKAFEGTYERYDVTHALEKIPERGCPVHRGTMNRYEWNVGSGIVLDQCPDCSGLWLDAGELEGYCQLIKRFYQNPPELSPEMKAKLDRVQSKLDADWKAGMDHAANLAIKWDLWFLDDLMRHLLKTFMRHH